ncbi:cytochrome P450 [Podospora conica]|nr:cytochrome P450 [Schizothecium conicum]
MLLDVILDGILAQKWPLLGTLLALYLARKIYVYQRLSDFNGPWAAGFSHIPHSWRLYLMDCHFWYDELCKKHGPIARIGPNLLVTSSMDVWLHILSKPGWKRADWYYQSARMEYQTDNIFTQTDNKLHDARRKAIAVGYSGRDNPALESTIDARILEFLALLRAHASTDALVRPVNLAKKVQYLTLDIISTAGYGRCLGMLAADADTHGYVRALEEGLFIGNLFMALGLSWLTQAPVIGPHLGPSPGDKTGFGALMGTVFDWADERWATHAEENRPDMLGSFMRGGLSKGELRTEALEQLIAGSDTTATSLRSTLVYLMSNPRVYRRLQGEVDAAVRGEGLGEGEVVSMAVAKELPYLQAVVRESLRVWPPVVSLFPHDAPKGGDTIVVGGREYRIPEGTEVGVSILSLFRSKEIYGEDAEAFKPERWFEEDVDRLEFMTKASDLLFSKGRWQCLGKNTAMLELNKTVFEILRNFDIALINAGNPWKVQAPIGLIVVDDLWVEVRVR